MTLGDNNSGSNGSNQDSSWRVKVGLAEMLKGGVIMDVTNAEQARIAEEAGACAVMALERVPSDIRRDGGVARHGFAACDSRNYGHSLHSRHGQSPHRPFCRGLRCSRRSKWISLTESEVLTPADEEHHVWKHDFQVPFVCGGAQFGRGPCAASPRARP